MINKIKKECISEHYDVILEMLHTTERMIKEAQEEANYHKGAMESRYDTFKEEAQYLVGAQERRKVNLQNSLNDYLRLSAILNNQEIEFSNVKAGACISLSNDEDVKNYFLTPSGFVKGSILVEGDVYQIISVHAPIISPFLGKVTGDYADDFEHVLSEYYISKII